MKKFILFIGGFPRSGKSSSINHLSKNYQTFSTSKLLEDVLDIAALNLGFETPLNYEENSQLKEIKRSQKILMAEKVLKPLLGQDVLVRAVFNQVEFNQRNVFAIESIGGEELRLLRELLDRSPHQYYVAYLNIRRDSELRGKDIRQLLTGETVYEFWNNGDIQELFNYLDSFMSTFLQFYEDKVY